MAQSDTHLKLGKKLGRTGTSILTSCTFHRTGVSNLDPIIDYQFADQNFDPRVTEFTKEYIFLKLYVLLK